MSVSWRKFLFPASNPEAVRDISLVWSSGACGGGDGVELHVDTRQQTGFVQSTMRVGRSELDGAKTTVWDECANMHKCERKRAPSL